MSKNVEINYFNGSTYEVLYPKTTAAQASAAERNFLQKGVFGVSATSSSDWIEVGRQIMNASYISARTTFSISGVNGGHAGILTFSLRTGSTASKLEAGTSNLYWLSLNDNSLADIFAITEEGNYAVLYLKLSGSYQCYHIGILDYAFGSYEFTDPTDSRLFKIKSNYNLNGNHKSSITATLNSVWNPSAPYSLIKDMSSLAYNTLATSDTLLIGDVSATQAKKVTVDEFTRYCPTTTSARTRPIQISTTDLTPKTSNLATGQVYLVCE